MASNAAPDRPTIRLDKWLFHARIVKSRGIGAELVTDGRVRVNGETTMKPHRAVGAGDVLTLGMQAGVRVLRILDIGTRRGPASEAQGLYDEIGGAVPPGPVGLIDPDGTAT